MFQIHLIDDENIDISRFDLYLSKLKLDLYSNYKLRSPADCKFLQNILKEHYNIRKILRIAIHLIKETTLGSFINSIQSQRKNQLFTKKPTFLDVKRNKTTIFSNPDQQIQERNPPSKDDRKEIFPEER